MTGPVDIEEGRRLLDAERAMDEGERWSISGSQMDLLAWSRNNLPVLLDELDRLEADRDRCKAAAISIEHDVCHVIGEALYGPDGWGDHVAQTLAQKAVNEIARLREALGAIHLGVWQPQPSLFDLASELLASRPSEEGQ